MVETFFNHPKNPWRYPEEHPEWRPPEATAQQDARKRAPQTLANARAIYERIASEGAPGYWSGSMIDEWEEKRAVRCDAAWADLEAAMKREDERRIAALVAALEEEREKFQRETLRTSELTQLLLRFEKLHVDRNHEPGAWSRGCIDCELVAEARALISKPVNVRAPAGSEEETNAG